MTKFYSYEVERHSNGEVSWCVMYREGEGTFIPGGAMGFGHSYAAPSHMSLDAPRVDRAAVDAECQAFNAVIARCQWPDYPNAPRAA